MKIKVLGSGSAGNCYLLETDTETLVLDCGISFKDIKIGLDFDLSRVVGTLVSHEHLDHSKSVKDLKKFGIDVWQPYLDEKKIQKKQFGSFNVQCFDLPHNGTENRGFLIEVDEEKILYMTDFEYCSYVFAKQKVNHILVEANNITTLLDKGKANYEHSIRGHANIEVTCKLLKVNKTNELRTVILCHLSSECSDETLFKKMARNVADCPVYIANAGLEVELRKKGERPF